MTKFTCEIGMVEKHVLTSVIEATDAAAAERIACDEIQNPLADIQERLKTALANAAHWKSEAHRVHSSLSAMYRQEHQQRTGLEFESDDLKKKIKSLESELDEATTAERPPRR